MKHRLTNMDLRSTQKQKSNFISANINNAGSLTCSIVQFIMWWFWAVHSSSTWWALWAREALWRNVFRGGASSTCATGEQLQITHDIQPSVKRENTGLTGCFSGQLLYNDRWDAEKYLPPLTLQCLHHNKRDYVVVIALLWSSYVSLQLFWTILNWNCGF